MKSTAILMHKPTFELELVHHKDIVSSKIYDKRGDFNFEKLLLISHFEMEMFLAPLPMVYTTSKTETIFDC